MLGGGLVVLSVDVMHHLFLSHQHEFLVVNRVLFGGVELWLHRSHVLPSVAVDEGSPIFSLATLSRSRLIAVNFSVVEQLVVVVAVRFAFFHFVPHLVLRHWIVLDQNFLIWVACQVLNRSSVSGVTGLGGLILVINLVLFLNAFHVSPGKLMSANEL